MNSCIYTPAPSVACPELSFRWVGSGSNRNWSNPANWNAHGFVPGLPPLDFDADVQIIGSPVEVILDVSPAVGTLVLGPNVSLRTSVSATRQLATDYILNFGQLVAGEGSTLSIGGEIFQVGPGAIYVGPDATLRIDPGVTNGTIRTFGDGRVELTDGAKLENVRSVALTGSIEAPNASTARLVGKIMNDGQVAALGQTRLLPVFGGTGGAVEIDGTGRIELLELESRIGDSGGVVRLINGSRHTISGSGAIDGPFHNFGIIAATKDVPLSIEGVGTNQGIIRADGGRLHVKRPISQSASGSLQAQRGGTAEVRANVFGVGGFMATEHGTIDFLDVRVFVAQCDNVDPPEGLVSLRRSQVIAAQSGYPNDLSITGGRFAVLEASLAYFKGPVLVCPAPHEGAVLELSDSSLFAGTLHFCSHGRLDARHSSITIDQNLGYEMNGESNWVVDPSVTFTFVGGTGRAHENSIGYAQLEVGDRNSVSSATFEFPEIVVGSGAHLSLFDRFDNGNRGAGDEALHVGVLRFANTEARLNRNGLQVYYETLIGSAEQIINLPRRRNDYDADGDIDLYDFASFDRCFSVDPADHGCRILDNNGDFRLGIADYGVFRIRMSGPR